MNSRFWRILFCVGVLHVLLLATLFLFDSKKIPPPAGDIVWINPGSFAQQAHNNITEPEVVIPALPSEEPESFLPEIPFTPQVSPQAVPKATPKPIPQAAPQVAKVTPKATPQVSPQAVSKATPKPILQATPQVAKVTPKATPQVSPPAVPKSTPKPIPQATPQVAKVTPKATPQVSPQAVSKATPKPIQATPQVAKATPKATSQATPQAVSKATPKPIPQATPQVVAKAAPQSTSHSKPETSSPSKKESTAAKQTVASTASHKNEKRGEKSKGKTDSGAATRTGVPPSQYEWYNHLIHDRFYGQWDQPTSLFDPQHKFSCVLEIQISKEGNIMNYQIIRGSGNEVLDHSVLEAAARTKQIDALPAGIGKNGVYTVRIEFELGN